MNLAYATSLDLVVPQTRFDSRYIRLKRAARGSRYNDTRRIRANILVEYLQCSSSGLESFNHEWLRGLPREALPTEVAVSAGLLVDRRSEV